jgi:hypothetical protein
MAEEAETIFTQSEDDIAPAEQPVLLKPAPPPIPEGRHRVYCIYDNTGGPRHSQSVFLESNAYGVGSGTLFHVIGSLNKGMIFETRVDLDPTQSPSFESRVYLGHVDVENHARLEGICREVEVPGKQLRPNGKTIDRSKPLRRGADWVAEVVEALYREGVVVR